jgi:hypothetical protein
VEGDRREGDAERQCGDTPRNANKGQQRTNWRAEGSHAPYILPSSHTACHPLAMILVQKPQPALSSPLNMSVPHRRQSSAPIVVQPTRIPGLLSLSKPPRSTPPRHQQCHVIKNAPKQQTASFTSPSLVRAHPQPAYTAPVTPSPHFRGRPQEKHPKDKIPHNKRYILAIPFMT